MNEKFFQLPQEKQQRIINAGYRVFALNSYKKSPMSEIADAAGISKSLLFHYFKNKKELYLFLWKKAAEITAEALREFQCHEKSDFFEIMDLGLQAKVHIMRKNPYIGVFSIKALYEREPDIREEIQKSYQYALNMSQKEILGKLDPNDFIPGLDLQQMYQQMYWASEGYVWQELTKGEIDVDKVEVDFREMVKFWRSVYGRRRNDERNRDE